MLRELNPCAAVVRRSGAGGGGSAAEGSTAGEDAERRRAAWRKAVGMPHGSNFAVGSEGQQAGHGKRRRVNHKSTEYGSLQPPSVRPRRGFEYGVLVETLNGCRVPSGSLRLLPGLPVYLDGSAEAPGTAYATASAAVVQPVPGGHTRAWQLPLDRACPQSAVSGEMMAAGVTLY